MRGWPEWSPSAARVSHKPWLSDWAGRGCQREIGSETKREDGAQRGQSSEETMGLGKVTEEA